MEEVVVTGSRLRDRTRAAAQRVTVYSREQIERSGQPTVSDFLHSLPEVSTASPEGFANGLQTIFGASSVQLHGLPVGTTLVLINGRPVQSTGLQAISFSGGFFDLNMIPAAAVEKVEVVPIGSSAVYGSDALAGVVNIVLKKDLRGTEMGVKYGHTSGLSDFQTSLSWGTGSPRGSFSLLGTFMTRDELQGSERSLTSISDFRPYGGPDGRSYNCTPGNVFFRTPYTFFPNGPSQPGVTVNSVAVPAGVAGTPTLAQFAAEAGNNNRCARADSLDVIPPTHRISAIASGNYWLTPSIEFSGEVLYSNIRQDNDEGRQFLFGQPGFQFFTVAADNPINPFGQTVGVGVAIPSIPNARTRVDTDFIRPLVSLRGALPQEWTWEVSGWFAKDKATLRQSAYPNGIAQIQAAINTGRLNPFLSGPIGAVDLLQSLTPEVVGDFSGELTGFSAVFTGSIFDPPAGPIKTAFGLEYNSELQDFNYGNNPFVTPGEGSSFGRFTRYRSAAFAEAKIPVLADDSARERLTLRLAGRVDRYSDFGQKATPQIGLELRPFESLLVRATYGEAFKAPPLFPLYWGSATLAGTVVDPRRNNEVVGITLHQGGNPDLKPQTGASREYGIVYSSKAFSGLDVSVAHWSVDLEDQMQRLSAQVVVTNEAFFPDLVTRAAGTPGPITEVRAGYVNFGRMSVAGLDYQVRYQLPSASWGTFTPSVVATQTTEYSAALIPGGASSDRASRASDDGNWAPRWKGNVGLLWQLGSLRASVTGRYTGKYRDYNSTRIIGNDWFADFNARYELGDLPGLGKVLESTYLELGAVNLLNKLPEYSAFQGGLAGYDAAQADIRGRFIYGQVGVRW